MDPNNLFNLPADGISNKKQKKKENKLNKLIREIDNDPNSITIQTGTDDKNQIITVFYVNGIVQGQNISYSENITKNFSNFLEKNVNDTVNTNINITIEPNQRPKLSFLDSIIHNKTILKSLEETNLEKDIIRKRKPDFLLDITNFKLKPKEDQKPLAEKKEENINSLKGLLTAGLESRRKQIEEDVEEDDEDEDTDFGGGTKNKKNKKNKNIINNRMNNILIKSGAGKTLILKKKYDETQQKYITTGIVICKYIMKIEFNDFGDERFDNIKNNKLFDISEMTYDCPLNEKKKEQPTNTHRLSPHLLNAIQNYADKHDEIQEMLITTISEIDPPIKKIWDLNSYVEKIADKLVPELKAAQLIESINQNKPNTKNELPKSIIDAINKSSREDNKSELMNLIQGFNGEKLKKINPNKANEIVKTSISLLDEIKKGKNLKPFKEIEKSNESVVVTSVLYNADMLERAANHVATQIINNQAKSQGIAKELNNMVDWDTEGGKIYSKKKTYKSNLKTRKNIH